MMPAFANSIIQTILFLLPGTMLSFASFPRTDALRRIVFGIGFSAALFGLVHFANQALGIQSMAGGAIEYAALIAALAWLSRKSIAWKAPLLIRSRISATAAQDVGIVLLASIGSALWKLIFVNPIRHFGTAYDYAGMFAKNAVPDLGFYTGMAADHANYAAHFMGAFWKNMQDAMSSSWHMMPGLSPSLLLMSLAYVGFAYILTIEFTGSRKSALFAACLMALGPIEIFYTSGSIFGHPLAYLAVFSLFYSYSSRTGWILSGMLAAAMATTYYTSTMANIVICAGFCLAVFAEHALAIHAEGGMSIRTRIRALIARAAKDKRSIGFASIAAVSLLLFLAISNDMLTFTDDLIKSAPSVKSVAGAISNATTTITRHDETLRPYRDPNLLGISAIRAQAIVLMLFAISFFIPFFTRRSFRASRERMQILYASIPAILCAAAFAYAGYPARAFDYLAFFAIMMTTVPEKLWVRFSICAFLLMAALGILTMRDKRIYFDIPAGEISGAKWIANNLDGKILSDQAFISLVISSGHHDVTGMSDTDPRLASMFYGADKKAFRDALSSDFASGKIDYLVTTSRMCDSYILMLNAPQMPIAPEAEAMIDETLEKLYDNGDVRIYAAKK